MSFFGNNNNNNNANQSGGFGGFGSAANTNSGFGAPSTSGSLFGGNTATSGGFGSAGFGNANSNSPFAANKPSGFGATATTSGGGLFGSGTSTSGGFGGGGFGSTNNASGGFGSSNTTTSLFGANKPATPSFGATNTNTSIFGGGGGNTAGGFGSNTTTSNPFTSASTGFGGANTSASTTFAPGFGGSTNNNNNNNNNGTASTPFQPFTEKDQATNTTSVYQSVTFQQPYQNKSFEELRTEDYLQGRRYGNTNGQAGSFGTSTGFGGGLFGSNNTANTANNTTGGNMFGGGGSSGFTGGFGANNSNSNTNTTGGFGSTTSGGLFGNQNKPASTGLFGSSNPATNTGGFGASTNTGGGGFGGASGGFGANTSSNPSNLFGANNNQQNKPAFGGFGASNTTGGFGNTNANTGGGLFGSNPGNSNTGGGIFGSNTNQQASNPFGSSNNNTGGGIFGNQNKPAGSSLFGSNNTNANTGGGLFGSNNNNQQSTGLFGAANANANSTPFGNNQNKPAGTGLFGSGQPSIGLNQNNSNSGGGLFGSNNQQQAGSLFGANPNAGGGIFANNQNKPASGGLFGGGNANSGGLFGSNNQAGQQNTGGNSLFGSVNQGNQNQQNNANSLFGGSSFGQGNPQQPQQLHTSLTNAPYGNEQLFGSLGTASPPVGPLATPLTGARPAASKTPSLLASTRVNSPVYTPRAGAVGRNGGYGFSYSTYGTPGSAYSVSLTPGASSLLKPTGSLGSALTSRLAKSMSMNNLRGDGTPQGESLLRPTPGSASSRYINTGSMRKLNIDRSLRTDLFGTATEHKQIEAAKDSDKTLKKQVSFDNSVGKGSTAEPSAANALVRTEDDGSGEDSPTLLRAPPQPRPQVSSTPEMEQVSSSALSTVPEDSEPQRPGSAPATKRPAEKKHHDEEEAGEYYMKPTLKDLNNMSRTQLSKLRGLTVGRAGVGRIEFGPCDLTNTVLDDICGNIVQLRPRSATVYHDDKNKPPMGKALNVPSTIYLDNSWPRSHGGKRAVSTKSGREYDKHIARLRRVGGTEFQSYDPETGVWCFNVAHFTTYGLDDDDETEQTEDMQPETSALSEPPSTPTQAHEPIVQSAESSPGNIEDDTFDFVRTRRSHSRSKQPPGSIGGISYDYDDPSADEVSDDEKMMSGGLGMVEMDDPFTSPGGAVQAPPAGALERERASMMLDENADLIDAAEDTQTEPEPGIPGSFLPDEPKPLRSILKPTLAVDNLISPEKLISTAWEQHLQATVSPQKRDRQMLRNLQQSALIDLQDEDGENAWKGSVLGQSMLNQSYLSQKSSKKAGLQSNAKGIQKKQLDTSQAFRTSMDIMNSLWAQDPSGKNTLATAKGFEIPHPKRSRLFDSNLDDREAAFHDCIKPSFANDGTLAYAVVGPDRRPLGGLAPSRQPILGAHARVCFAHFTIDFSIASETLIMQHDATPIEARDGFAHAQPMARVNFSELFRAASDPDISEQAAWQLCSILFDPIQVVGEGIISGMSDAQINEYEPRVRMDVFAAFWARLAGQSVEEQLTQRNATPEERALLYLTMNDIAGAARVLADAKDFRLATLVAQLPSATPNSRAIMKNQINAWRERNDWSDMPDAVRALYAILAGEVCTVPGKTGPPENRVSELQISECFGLDWTQSLGLRVFFGGHRAIRDVVQAYANDLETGREPVRPVTRWPPPLPQGDHSAEDILMGLLRLSLPGAGDLTELVEPQSGNGFSGNIRLEWQLATVLRSIGFTLAPEKMDQLTVSFAAALEAAEELVHASWVLLHLHHPISRQVAVTDLLHRQSDFIPEPHRDGELVRYPTSVFEVLTNEFSIPAPILWSAKAQHAHALLHDPHRQTLCLLYAGDVDAAHAVLCSTVGPRAVIAQSADAIAALGPLIAKFPRQPRPDGWAAGGAVYADFSRAVHLRRSGGGSGSNNSHSHELQTVLTRLTAGLDRMKARRSNHMGLEEHVALLEMDAVALDLWRDLAVDLADHAVRARVLDARKAMRAARAPPVRFERFRHSLFPGEMVDDADEPQDEDADMDVLMVE